MEFLKQYIGTLITVITIIVTVSIAWGSLNTRVEANTEKLKNTVQREEFTAILDGQDKMNQQVNKRMDRVEDKLDRIIERLNK